MGPTKALLVFCEGPHDVAFVKRVFMNFFHAEKARGTDGDGLKFSEYPAPFNQLFRASVEKHAVKDLSLDMAHKFFLPDRTLITGDWLILLFNAGGAKQVEKVKLFLSDFMVLYQESSVFPQDASTVITDAKYLFLYDADHQTPNDIAVWMQRQFSHIEDVEWSLGEWVIEKHLRGVIQGDKALYVWAGEDGKGTLEDILLPVYMESNSDLIKKSRTFVDDSFSWDIDNANPKKQFRLKAEQSKAVLCSAGQGKRPGKSLNVIIDDNVLGDKTIFLGNQPVKNFSSFIMDFTQMNGTSEENKEP